LDTHDVARGRASYINGGEDSEEALAQVLGTIPRGALVIGIDSDGLFTPSEQRELAAHIPDAQLVIIQSKNGHDGFLLEFEEINRCVHLGDHFRQSHLTLPRQISGFLYKVLPELYQGEGPVEAGQVDSSFEVTRTNTFGEAEVDVAMW
jgi:homoserine O-acetyltransferase